MMPEAKEARTIQLFASERRLLVMVNIGEFPSMPFVFDLGSSGNLISLKAAKLLHLPENGPSRSVDGNGVPVPGFDTCLTDLAIGGIAVPDQRATAYPMTGTGEEGIISPMQFAGSLIRFDGPRSRVTILSEDFDRSALNQPRAWAGRVGDAHPATDIVASGYRIEAKLDTGSDAELILPLEWAKKLALRAEPVVVGSMQTAGTTSPIYRATIVGNTAIAGENHAEFSVYFAETQVALVGWPLIRTMTFYMDPAKNMTWFGIADPMAK